MRQRMLHPCIGIGLLAALFVQGTAVAEITSIEGSAQVNVQEILNGAPADENEANDSYPSTSSEFPLQVVASLEATGGQVAAATVAAQLADPRIINRPNPEDFALNLALNTLSAQIRYTASGQSQEIRSIVYKSDEVNRPDGATIRLTGRMFVDGALTVYSPLAGSDLTGAQVKLIITIVQQGEGDAKTLLSGSVALTGQADGQAAVSAEGDFPTRSLIKTDLSAVSPEFKSFQVLIVPSLSINYDYEAVVGQPLQLVATVAIEAENVEGSSGVACVIGTPVDALQEVIDATQGQTAATKLISALQKERAAPTGEPAFGRTVQPTLQNLCGFVGFESLAGAVMLAGLSTALPQRKRGR